MCVGVVAAQADTDPKPTQSKDQTNNQNSESSAPSTNKKPEPPILIYLVSGGRMEVDEARETNDGVWYRSAGVTALLDSKRVVRIERPSTTETKTVAAKESVELGVWTIGDAAKVERFFFNKFGRHLPTTAVGQSDLHTRWGLDHRQGIDVGVHPDSAEGMALAAFLRSEKIPFMAFRTAIPGVATGPHIHVGYASHRIPPR